jgi:Ice-binding-like
MTNFRALQVGSGLLLVSLGAACSSSSAGNGGNSGEGGTPGDDGTAVDGAAAGDGANTNPPDAAGGAPGANAVALGTAGTYAILAMSGISTVPTSAVTGNLGVSPAAASFITGFSLTADGTDVFATSPQVTGKVYAADYAVPTPVNLTTAIADMQTAFVDAAGRAPGGTELGAGNVGGKTLTPGVYQWTTGLLVPTNVTLSGSATDVWIFQIAQDLTVSSAANVVLSGGAVNANIFWEVAGAVNIGTTAHLEGVVLSKTGITLGTGASINGRLLAQTAVSIDSSTIVAP